MDHPRNYELQEVSESTLFNAATLQRFGLPYDFDSLSSTTLPELCPCCRAPLVDLSIYVPIPLHTRIFLWQAHMGRCGGDGRRLQAHEIVKMTIKKLVLGCPDPGGVAVPPANMIIEPPHLRNDKSKPGDIYIIGGALHQLDSVMDVVISSSLTQSCLLPSSKSSDFVLRKAENMKFTKDLRS